MSRPHHSPTVDRPLRRGKWLLLLLLAGDCGGDPAPESPRGPPLADAPSAVALRPGDSLFRQLDHCRVDDLPASNLPEDLRALLGDAVTFRTREILYEDWTPWHNKASDALLRETDGNAHALRFHPTVQPLPDTPVSVLIDGVPVPAGAEDTRPLPDPLVFWDDEHQEVRAIASREPEHVSLRMHVDPGPLFARAERHLTAAPGATTTAADLVGRLEQEQVSRRTLFLPAPGRVTVGPLLLEGDRLRLALAVRNRQFALADGELVRTSGRGDGVTFAVEVRDAAGTRRVFERTLSAEQVGTGWQEDAVDLAEFTGRKVELALVTEPGPDGSTDFDYAAWGDLTLEGTPTRTPDRPHVVLIDIDTLRADRLSCLGNPVPTTPGLDAWAREHAVSYAEARAASSWTLPSTSSLFTGLSVLQHGVDEFPDRITRELRPLPLVLRDAGYETRGEAEGLYVEPAFGFDQGFDLYDCTRLNQPNWKDALEWIRTRRSERPFFLFLHTYLVHAPWPFLDRLGDCPPAAGSALQGEAVTYAAHINPFRAGQLAFDAADQAYISRLYDERVHDLDRRLAPFLEKLDAALAGTEYLVIFTSDHGDEFFDHGGLDHGHTLFQELLHVPLIIRYPAGVDAPPPGTVVRTPVSGLDLLPTLLDVLHLEPGGDPPLAGRSLLAADGPPVPLFADLGQSFRSVEFQGWKLILGGLKGGKATQLYHLAEDPAESTDVAAAHPDLVKKLLRMLEQRQKAFPPVASGGEAALDSDLLRNLEAAGYTVGDKDR